MLASMIIIYNVSPINEKFLLFVLSGILFIVSTYWASSKSKINQTILSKRSIYYLFTLAVTISTIKTIVLLTAIGGLPIFDNQGSNAYIDFDLKNKIRSSILLGLGSADLILLSFIIPLIKKHRSRILAMIVLVSFIAIGMVSGKKTAIFNIFIAVALGEYLRICFLEKQQKFFLSSKFIFVGLLVSFLWAGYVYTKTEGLEKFIVDSSFISSSLDFVMYQWAYPFELFLSDDLSQFFESYSVNPFTYFFHSILSPLGLPVFSSSIGPSIFEYLTGVNSGNGINPTFIIEGYVLVGRLLPLYAILAGLLIGRGRTYLIKIKCIEYRIALLALLLPALYTFAIDGLLFFKIFYVVIFIFLFMIIPLRRIFYSSIKTHG